MGGHWGPACGTPSRSPSPIFASPRAPHHAVLPRHRPKKWRQSTRVKAAKLRAKENLSPPHVQSASPVSGDSSAVGVPHPRKVLFSRLHGHWWKTVQSVPLFILRLLVPPPSSPTPATPSLLLLSSSSSSPDKWPLLPFPVALLLIERPHSLAPPVSGTLLGF